jgi:2-polyprenyl-3-methyl-5-hydroxy-6-metoxy-1,4-benzoquinol methylase
MIICPVCSKEIHLSKQNVYCDGGHRFAVRNGVYQILRPDFKLRLENFLTAFEDSRKDYIAKIDPKQFKDLPYVDFDRKRWRLRQFDLELIKSKFNKKGKTLEIGAWNGWLTNRLVEMGNDVTAINLFSHHLDGLGAYQYYENEWLSIQMDVDDLSILKSKYDLIVVNRCLPYFKNLNKTLTQIKSLLNSGGIVVITGISFHRNPMHVIRGLNRATMEFEAKYKTKFNIRSFKGYLDRSDLLLLKKHDIKLYMYKQLKLKSLLGYIIPSKPFYYYGVYVKARDIRMPKIS